MAKQNYAFAKRQRDLVKKQKKDEKRLRKADEQVPPAQVNSGDPAAGETTEAL